MSNVTPARPRTASVWLYGADKHMRLRLRQWSFTFVVYSCYGLLMGWAWHWGTITPAYLAAWSMAVYSGLAVFYGLIRSGLSTRWRDPALTRGQIVFGIVTASAGYVSIPPYGTAVLFSLLLTLMFGAFSLSGATMLRLTVLSVACVSGAIALATGGQPSRLDLFNVATLVFVLPGISVLSVRLGRMREKLFQHKHSLEEAYARIERLAARDELTGLLNRRCINDALHREQAAVARAAGAACVAMLDIDHFKRINDTYGHAGGDVVLQRFARLAEQTLRTTDLVARWGGEEFLVLMPQTEAACAEAAVQRLLAAVRDAAFPPPCGDLRVTVSAGVAAFDAGADVPALVEQADRALYAAKVGGRDRVVMAPCVNAGTAAAPALA